LRERKTAPANLLESILWPNGPRLPHTAESTRAYKLTPKEGSKTRKGLYKVRRVPQANTRSRLEHDFLPIRTIPISKMD